MSIWNLDGLRRRIKATFRLWGLGATGIAPVLVPVPGGTIDAPERGDVVRRGPITVEGWLLFASGPATRIEVWLGDELLGRARLGLSRPDLADAAKQGAGAVAGFCLTADITEWPGEDGDATLRVVATGVADEHLELEPLRVRVEPSPRPPVLAPHSPLPLEPESAGEPRRRVLVYAHQLERGGAETFMVELACSLVKRGLAEVTVLTAINGPLKKRLEDAGVPVHASSPAPVDDLGSHLGRIDELTAWAQGRGFELALVNTASPFAVPGAELASRLGIPAVWFIHESFALPVLWKDFEPEVRVLAEAALDEAALAVFEAEATQRLHEHRIGSERCVTLPYALDFDAIEGERGAFSRAAAREATGVAADAEIVLCVGTIEPRKAQVPLAQAFDLIADRHPAAQIVFLGGRENPDTKLLEEWIDSLGRADRMRVVPVTADVNAWYGLSDLLVCASDIESLPRAVLEAMAWELPVVATSVFGLPELVKEGETGWLCEPGDTRALADALERALSTPKEDRIGMGRAARALVERNHALDSYVPELMELLDGLER
ncbi:MAG TPA: glycosyltransferase family 4 protein [Solirubrobacterales bacterium]